MRHLESQLQASCVMWFRMQYPQYASHLFAIGNGVPNNARQGAIRKREGAVSGVADLMLMLPQGSFGGLFIEMKAPEGKLSKEQKAFQNRAVDAGYVYCICKAFDQFQAVIRAYLK